MSRTPYALVALLAVQSPALAAHCTQPYAPDIAAGAASTEQKVAQLRDDVQSFIQASDVYQQCLIDGAKLDAAAKFKLEPLLEANQHEKQRVADAFNNALKSYKSSGTTKLSDAKN